MSIAECILYALRTTIDVDVVVEGVTRTTVCDILPVVAFNALVEVHILIVTELISIVVDLAGITSVVEQGIFILPLGIFVGVENVVGLRNRLPAVVGIIAHLGLTCLTALGRYQDNAVGTTRTVDSG